MIKIKPFLIAGLLLTGLPFRQLPKSESNDSNFSVGINGGVN